MKVFKTYRQLLTVLRNRGVDIKTDSAGTRTLKILEQENYYKVINGYKRLFIATPATPTSDEIYKAGTTFDEIYALYDFDRELRHILEMPAQTRKQFQGSRRPYVFRRAWT